MLSPILFFYLRKINSASLSIILGHERNFEHNLSNPTSSSNLKLSIEVTLLFTVQLYNY